jgi:hypothetical protein
MGLVFGTVARDYFAQHEARRFRGRVHTDNYVWEAKYLSTFCRYFSY